jgi:DNA mismatch repair protein MutL
MQNEHKIRKLNEKVINQIAAGEVVERPASVVKELVENSIDAQATQITVELEEGGKRSIRVIDNGIGLSKDQLDLVFERHATSKIQEFGDLEITHSLGFRGEALASISSISEIEFASKTEEDSSGYSIDEQGEIKPAAIPQGTQVTVSNIFSNTPAREKFLKTDATEYKKCLEVLEAHALAHPEIGFTLFHKQKQVFDYAPATKQDRITQVLGADFSSKLLPIFYGGNELSIEGFIGKPELAKQRAYNQYLLINGRSINAPYFTHAIRNAFGSTIFPAEKPPFVLWLTISPQDVDMNVHPRKEEARFHFQSMVYNKLMHSIKHVLNENVLTPKVNFAPNQVQSFMPSQSNFTNNSPKPLQKDSLAMFMPSNLDRSKRSLNEPLSQVQKQANENHLLPISQMANSYIICQSEEGLVIVDQHAAHERVMYEQLKEYARNKSSKSQQLLVPIQVDLSNSELETLKQAQPILKNIGFDIQEFGGQTVLISAIPDKFSKNDIEDIFRGLMSDLQEGHDFSNLDLIEDIVINYASCRGAIKFGQPLTHEEMVGLITEMEAIKGREYSCPHGRPTMIELSFDDLEKEFKRRK